jgi:hypothetical protein
LSSNKKILFLSFNTIFSKGGHSKNFLNLIKHIEPELKRNNFTAYIISYNNTADEKADNIHKISKTVFLKSYRIKIFKRFFPSGNVVFKISEYIINFIKTLLYVIIYSPHIIYAYADKPLYMTFSLKTFLKFKLIYDMRGDILDEQKVQGASKRYLSILSKIHTKALNTVDLAFTVSNSYNINSEVELIPKFNYYDGEVFKYDESSMFKKKRELQLEDKFVFVYTGNTHYYQYLEGTVKFFSHFLENIVILFL